MKPATLRTGARGFTLIEIAVVVALIGIILTAGLKIAGALLESAAGTSTLKKQQAIKDALISYLGKYNRLPCPDTGISSYTGVLGGAGAGAPDGFENRVTPGNVSSNCAAAYGVLPYATLGLPREAALDGWQNYFSYHIAQLTGAYAGIAGNATVSPFFWAITPVAGPNLYPEVNAGNITINDRDPNSGASVTLTTQAVAVVISFGRNGLGGWQIGGGQYPLPAGADENSNATQAGAASPVYWARQATDNTAATGGAFDDVVMYLDASALLTPLYQANILMSPVAGMNQQFTTVRNAVFAYVVGHASSCPGTSSPSLPLPLWSNLTLPSNFPAGEPWGRPWSTVAYVRNRTNVDPSDTGAAVTLTSGSGTSVQTSIITAADIQAAAATWYTTCISLYNSSHAAGGGGGGGGG